MQFPPQGCCAERANTSDVYASQETSHAPRNCLLYSSNFQKKTKKHTHTVTFFGLQLPFSGDHACQTAKLADLGAGRAVTQRQLHPGIPHRQTWQGDDGLQPQNTHMTVPPPKTIASSLYVTQPSLTSSKGRMSHYRDPVHKIADYGEDNDL